MFRYYEEVGDMMSLDVCEVSFLNEEKVEALKPLVDQLSGLADLYKALADETRCKLLYALSLQELCVCNLAAIIESSQSNVSHHLRYLRAARLVKSRKVGRQVFYSLDDSHVEALIEQGIEHLKHI